MSPLISMEDFVYCFRKQFTFQKGKGGFRKDMYYTAYNSEMKLKNDLWGMMVFIYTAPMYGLLEDEIVKELKISRHFYWKLEEMTKVLTSATVKDGDITLAKVIHAKAGLVKNSIAHHLGVRLQTKKLPLLAGL